MPFSVGSLVAGRVVRLLVRTQPPVRLLPVSCLLSLAALLVFVFAHGALWEVFVTMAVAGLGVGVNFAVTPGLVVGSVPAHETGSAMSFNQVVKYIGYSAGSALSAVILQAATAPGHDLPPENGYRTAGLVGCAVWAATAVVAYALVRSGSRGPSAQVRIGRPALAADGVSEPDGAGLVADTGTSR
ncbi:MFS transporter [Streptomyces sp. NPDC005227]|uniref:MFS transporter n=1 Tax=Streptomyces sp. NPDC005227 TaxID=3364707 RepID=UPI0036C20945